MSFDWRSDEFPALNFSKGRQVGFIAQEMAGVLPEAVTTDHNGYYRMAYSEVTPVLVEAIKEQHLQIQDQQLTVKQQQAQIEEQHQQLRQKHARIEKLEARLATLERVVKNLSVRRRPRRR